MAIPTQKAGLQPAMAKQVGRTETERKGFEKKEMAPPEHVRRWDRLKNTIPDTRIPDSARK